MSAEAPVVVIGAGIVGAATARALQRAGHAVTLVDSGEPGNATSFGNAGYLSVDSLVPMARPATLKKLPKMLMDRDGQIQEAHSISAGLDYPGIGPEHAWLADMGRVKFLSATDAEALEAFKLCSRLEGIIPALEPAHALARVMDLAPQKPKDHLMVVNLSGRGDKDLASVAAYLEQRAG